MLKTMVKQRNYPLVLLNLKRKILIKAMISKLMAKKGTNYQVQMIKNLMIYQNHKMIRLRKSHSRQTHPNN